MTSTTKLPVWFWVIGIVGLLWNLLGVTAYLGEAYMPAETLAELSQGDQDYFANRPAWVTAAYAIAVFAGALGCVALLLRKRWAVTLFMVSFAAVLIQQIYNFFIQDYIELSGARLVWPIIILIVAALLYWYSKGAREKAWIS